MLFPLKTSRPASLRQKHSVFPVFPFIVGVSLLGSSSLILVNVSWGQQAPPHKDAAQPKTEAPSREGLVKVEIPDVSQADEATVNAAWNQLQEQMLEAEITDVRSAIATYQQFFVGGAFRFPKVGIQIASRIARLYRVDLRDYEKTIEIYDWALARYKDQPEVAQLQRERTAVVQALALAEKAQHEKAQGQKPVASTLALPVSPVAASVKPLAPVRTGSSLAELAPLKATIVPSATGGLSQVGVPVIAGNALGWRPGPDRCITALTRDLNGRIWIATEDSGVWCYDATLPLKGNQTSRASVPGKLVSTVPLSSYGSRWRQFTAKDGVGDESVYSLAVDQQGRVWAGTLNHGVSVWNGQVWKNYGIQEGPLGEHIFDIAVCPTDGDVWMAPNVGLTRYSPSKDSWSYITMADGLPSDQIQTLAFDGRGNILVGTQSDGIAIASVTDGYHSWEYTQSPKQISEGARGKGLPSNLINAVLVARDWTYYVATTTGLAWSNDAGKNWQFVRGKDFAEKAKSKQQKSVQDALLAEDYVSCIAEDEHGRLWVGHWQAGHEVIDVPQLSLKSQSHAFTLQNTQDISQRLVLGEARTTSAYKVIGREQSGLVRAILPQPNHPTLIGRYNDGLSESLLVPRILSAKDVTQALANTVVPAKEPSRDGIVHETKITSFPSIQKPPALEELNALLKRANSVSSLTEDDSYVRAISDDWKTQGDWLGRYGRYYARLCAMNSPYDLVWGTGKNPVPYVAHIGPNTDLGDSLRYWVHWLYTDNRSALEMPTTYYKSRLAEGLTALGSEPVRRQDRRQSEIDDHGEFYPMSRDGPNLYVTLTVPDGVHMLSLYAINKDGQASYNRLRDFKVSIRRHPDEKPLGDIQGLQTWPELSSTRIRDFRGGVYKRFVVNGPQTLTIEVARNYSFNTILSGVFLDELSEEPKPYFQESAIFVHEDESVVAQNAVSVTNPENEIVERLWHELERAKDQNPVWWATEARPIYSRLSLWLEKACMQALQFSPISRP